jgi:hypothetical protein
MTSSPCTPAEALTSDTVRREFFESGRLCDRVCFGPKPGEPHGGSTCGGIAVDHLAGTAFAFRGRYDASSRIEWRLDGDQGRGAPAINVR